MNEVESKLEKSVEMEDPKDLASCNRLLLDQQRLEDQLDNRRQELNDIKVRKEQFRKIMACSSAALAT